MKIVFLFDHKQVEIRPSTIPEVGDSIQTSSFDDVGDRETLQPPYAYQVVARSWNYGTGTCVIELSRYSFDELPERFTL